MATNKKAPITVATQYGRSALTHPFLKSWTLSLRTRMPETRSQTGLTFGVPIWMERFLLTPLLVVSLSYLYGLRHRHSSSEIGKRQPCQR